jgi:twinkle protein
MPMTWEDVGIKIPSAGAGPEVYTTCPKCSASRKNRSAKCLSANVERGVWLCHHCGWSGALATGRETRREVGWRKPEWRRPDPHSATALSAEALAWFEGRGISAAVLERNGVHSCMVYMPQLEQHVSAVAFPYRRSGELVNHKYRDGRKNFRMDTGAERVLYKFDDIDPACLVWCEGEIDALSFETAGIVSCVSVPDGAPAENTKHYGSKFTFLDSAEQRVAAVKRHIIAVDSDGPGRRLEDELARRLGREKCWRVRWPAGCKDANEVLVKFGADEVRWYVDHAEPFPIEGVFSIESESEKIRHLYRHGFERGHKTGWASLDPHYTVRPGEFTVVTGAPGSGKSNFVDALLVNLAKDHGWSFGLFSPENQPIEDHMSRVVEKYVGLPFSDGPRRRMSETDLTEGIEWAREHFWWILPQDEKQWEIGWILARAKELVYSHGIRGLVIDPWNELEPQRGPKETETEHVSRVLRTVRQWARQRGVHVWIVVHPTKLQRKDNGEYPVPTLWDCAGSAHWRNKADNGLCVWRDLDPESKRSHEVDIHVQKIRFRQIGRLGKVTLSYDSATATYADRFGTAPVDDEGRYGG